MKRHTAFGFLACLLALPLHADPFGGGTVLQPTTASGGTGTVANLQSDDDTKYSVAKSGTMTVGGFASGTGTINSVYIFAQCTTEADYSGTNKLKVNGVDTTIQPAVRDYGSWRHTEITGGSFGIDTWAEIASLSITFTNNDGGGGDAALFDCIYIVVNPTEALPIHPTWLEDFNGTGAADPLVWNYEVGYQRNNEDQYYQSGTSNGWREDGNFVIEARTESVGGYDYTSASIVTSNKYYWKFGRAQIRAKIPSKPGMWPAIWGTGETGQWPHNGEVDIMEYYGEKILANCAVGTTQQWNAKWDAANRSMNSLLAVDPNWRDEWHIWTMQWDEQNVRLYVDNILMNTIPQTWLRNSPGYNSSWGPEYPFQDNGMSCWLNLAIGGNAGGNPAGTMATGPQRYFIDYWKVWEGATSNVAPTDITLDGNVIQEGLPAGTTVGNLTAADADPGEVLRYTLVSGTGDTHNSQFSIPEFISDNTLAGVLKTNVVLDYADGATRSIRVRVTDIEGASYTKIFTINVLGDTLIDVSAPSVVVPEGGTETFQVKLRTLPASNVTVNVSRQSGDSDITVSGGASLTFTPLNGTSWQTVTLAAAEDADNSNGTATIQCVDAGATYTTATLDATESENDNGAPVVDAGLDDTVFFAGGAPWNPSSLSPAAWYDAADASTITESGGAVSQWDDKSGNGYHLTQASGGAQPTYSATGWDGALPDLSFDGTADVLENASLLNLGSMTIAAVYDQNSTTDGRVFGARGKALNGKWTFAMSSDNSLRYDGAKLTGNAVPAALGKHLRVSTRTTSSQLDHVDGSQNLTATAVLPNIEGYINVGQVIPNPSGWFNGDFAEGVVIFGTLSTTDREKLEGYFAHKWGLADSLPGGHPYKAAAPGGSSAVANLNGTVSDPNGDAVTTVWTMVSGPGGVTFGDASAVDTTASFSVVGTYVLRLTADDGISQTSNDVTITVSNPNAYSTWAGGTFTHAFTNIGYALSPDGDNTANLVEFAFGMDPTINDGGPLSYVANGDVTTHGNPILHNFATPETPDYRAVFLRRKDHVTAGLTYNVKFSAGLGQWTTSGTTPTVLTGAGSSGDYEAVSVPYPGTVPLQAGGNAPPQFFQIEVTID